MAPPDPDTPPIGFHPIQSSALTAGGSGGAAKIEWFLSAWAKSALGRGVPEGSLEAEVHLHLRAQGLTPMADAHLERLLRSAAHAYSADVEVH